jgi:flavin-binding protein dodecin
MEVRMPDHVYKHIELTGSSKNNIEEAVQNAVVKANQSVRNMRWFEMVDLRGHIDNGNVSHWQVTIKVGFTLED